MVSVETKIGTRIYSRPLIGCKINSNLLVINPLNLSALKIALVLFSNVGKYRKTITKGKIKLNGNFNFCKLATHSPICVLVIAKVAAIKVGKIRRPPINKNDPKIDHESLISLKIVKLHNINKLKITKYITPSL